MNARKTINTLTREERREVAEDPNTSVELLMELAGDEDSDVRRNVAKHPNTPVSALEKLADDKDEDVRRIVHWVLKDRKDIHPWEKALIEGILDSQE